MWARQSKFHAIEGPNARDQIVFYACDCHSFLVKAIRMPSTYLPLMRNSKLEIWIAGSSGRPQLAYTLILQSNIATNIALVQCNTVAQGIQFWKTRGKNFC